MTQITDQRIRYGMVACAAIIGIATACMKDRAVDVVLSGDYAVDLHHDSGDVEIPTVVGVPDFVVDLLADEGYALDDVKSIDIAGAAYGTLALEGDHDWVISGEVDVQRTDGIVAGPTEQLLAYTEVSVQGALGRRITAPLSAAGVAVVNGAFNDYINGESPVLEFRLRNGDTSPDPSVLDPMVFDWRLWLEVRVVIEVETRVPDPF